MKFIQTSLHGAYRVELEPIRDSRGFFARSWCKQEFLDHRIDIEIVQSNVSYNQKKGTLRGMHFQEEPFAEPKIIRCTHGKIYDVFIDIRPDSPTYLQWDSVELSAASYQMMYLPAGFAHGFLTLEEHSEVLYQMAQFFNPAAVRGIRWDDPLFRIDWPEEITTISDKDLAYPDFVP